MKKNPSPSAPIRAHPRSKEMKRWPTKTLAQIATVVRGVTFDKTQVSDLPGKETVPILRAGNIQTSLLTDSDLVYVSTKLVTASQRMKRGDLAICMSSGSPAIVGKTAHLENDWNGSVGAFCAIVRFDTNVQHRFGSYWFRSPAFFQWRDSNAKGANIQNLRRSDLESLSIPVPPLAEQERIVKLLDEADELRKLRAQADRRTAALLPALFHEMFGDPDKGQNSSPTSPLGEHIDLLTGFPFKSEEYVASSGSVRLCRGANVSPQRVDWSDVRYWPSDRANEVQQYELCNGDIILAMDRPWISDGLKVARLTNADLPCFLVQRVARIRPKATLVADFIYQSLCHPSFAAHCNLVKTETTVPHISPNNIRSFRVPVPPLPLQKEFAQRVGEIREMDAAQAASRRRLEALFQSLLHRAFNGELWHMAGRFVHYQDHYQLVASRDPSGGDNYLRAALLAAQSVTRTTGQGFPS